MKLHLGCWKRYIPGFVHVDICRLPHIDYVSTVDKLPMFPDDSAELIYASHVLEYFDLQEGEAVLREWARILAPQGVLRIAVPDFPALIKVYELTGNINKILGPLYGRMEVKLGEDQSTLIYHKIVYDFESLKNLLEKAGFENVCPYDWRQTIHKDYDDHSQAYYPHMDKDSGLLTSLNIEAVKSTGK